MTGFDISASWEAYYATEEAKAESEAIMRNYRAILADYSTENMGQVARSIYKYTDCGATVGVLVEDQYGSKNWVYDELELYKIDASSAVYAISVGSIVEGVEQTTETREVLLDRWLEDDQRFATPAEVVKDLERAISAVEEEANEIWLATHGCKTCAAHWGYEKDDDLWEGITPVWDECPDCNGNGEII